MPTETQFKELFKECKREWKEANYDGKGSIAGYLLTGPNGNTIFLPASGDHKGSDFHAGLYGNYWSAEINSDCTRNARSLFFDSGYWFTGYSNRSNGFPVRPVCPSAE